MGSSGSDPGREASRRPVIGISAYEEVAVHGVWQQRVVLVPSGYIDLVLGAGGLPMLLPPRAELPAVVDELDGLLLAGGPDVEPRRYGAVPDAATGPTRPMRDRAELGMLDRALQLDLPVLGVCRGMQLMNVAMGGTLVQHLPDRLGHDDHRPVPGTFGATTVRLDPAGRVGMAAGPRAQVSCHHHNGIDRVAPGFSVTGWAADGTVEAIELPGDRFVVGVQWHPEQDSADLRLLHAFVAAARARAGRTRPA